MNSNRTVTEKVKFCADFLLSLVKTDKMNIDAGDLFFLFDEPNVVALEYEWGEEYGILKRKANSR